MDHLLYLMFRCDGDVMKNLEFLWDLNTPQIAISASASIFPCSTLASAVPRPAAATVEAGCATTANERRQAAGKTQRSRLDGKPGPANQA